MLGFDLFNYFFPGKVFAAEALWRGELPLWNPGVFFGAPFLANVQMGVLYPPNLLFLLWEFPRAVAISQWLHLSAGAAGMYLLCRRVWRLAPFPSAAGALAFGGGGFFGAHMGHLNQVHAGIWLPWLALCQFRLAAQLPSFHRSAPWLVAGGAVVALQLTAGHTQEVYYSLFALGLLAAGFTLLPPAWAPRRIGHLAALAVMVANGAFIAAAQLIPTLELSGLSYRQGGVSLEEAAAFGVERTNLLESLLPTFWSIPGQEVTGYVGVTALVLALGAAASRARRTVVALAALSLFAIALTLGPYTPLFPVLHQWAPMFSSFRAPGRWLLISSFALAGLAAHGLDALRYSRSHAYRERATALFALAAAAMAGLVVLFAWRSEQVHAIHWLPHGRVLVLWLGAALGTLALGVLSATSQRPWAAAVLVGVLALETGFAAREMEYNRPGDQSLYRDRPAIAALGAAQGGGALGGSRTLSLAVEERLDGERLRRTVPEGDGEYRRYAAMREVLRPNLGTVYGLPSIDGYDGGLLPLHDYALFKSVLVPHETPVPHFTLAAQAPLQPDARLLGALNVGQLVTDGRNVRPGVDWTLRETAGSAALLYENRLVQPRAMLVQDAVVEPDPRRAVELLRTLDLARTALIERPLPAGTLPVAGPASTAGQVGLAGAATIVRYDAGALEIESNSAVPALLVISDTYYPGWRASIDGNAAPLLRANLLFRAVPVPAGLHRVRVWYDPLSVKLGFVVTGLALAANALILWRWRVRRARIGMSKDG